MKIKLVIGALVACFAGVAPSVSASPLPPANHAYAEQNYWGAITGGYYVGYNGQDDLTNNGYATNLGSFITKEMWLLMQENPRAWIESGDEVGPINNIYWQGHFFAIKRLNGSFYEEQLGSSGPFGNHSIEIAYGANSTWEVWIDGTRARQISSMPQWTQGVALLAGIESSDDSNTFVDGTYFDGVQYRDNLYPSVSWYYWNSAVNNDSNTLGWHSAFVYPAFPNVPQVILRNH